MAIVVALQHLTRYSYDRPVELSPQIIRLRPAAHARAAISAYSLDLSPKPHFLHFQQDPFGNWLARVAFPQPLARELEVSVELVVELVTQNPFDFFVEEYAETLPFQYDGELARSLRPYLEVEPPGPRLASFLGRVRDDLARDGRRSIDLLVDVNQLVQRSLRYDVRMEPGVFAPEETLERGHGSCRDFAWLLVQVLRQLGIAARFASGYSIQLVADQKPIEGPAGVGLDSVDLHAWAEAYLPGAGWIGLDATSGLLCGEGHIPLACTPEPSSAAPITGSYGFTKQSEDDEVEARLEVTMRVTRIEDRPRPTKPYTQEQWQALLACGDEVDRRLSEDDVRLTMGGEPTFVAASDPDAEEWSTSALGPSKPRYADRLLRRLASRYAPSGLLHHGQGKWYPGEPLPRWAYSCYYRKDGEPIWQDATLIAGESTAPASTIDDADALARALAKRLRVDERFLVPAYEDVVYHLWRERRLPVNVDPFDSKLELAEERERLRRVFERGLASAVGYALPMRAVWENGGLRWQSGRWFFRDARMYLLPGDSPMGLRLPLDSLPWSAEEDVHPVWPVDPMAPRPALPSRRAFQHMPSSATAWTDTTPSPPPHGLSAGDFVRTALCIEPREGVLHVFMPPTEDLESYLALVCAVEDSAAELGTKLRIEGYHPPSDPRLLRIQLTPDPGVLEVNVQPVASFRELVANTTTLYAEAREIGLVSENFMLDGRHVGTGGGNHITLGGPTPGDSPFLRRPDLLRSFTSYWLNHPSLSYLFSGLFVGPTSQAPRLDEARHDALYELDIAHGVLSNGPTPPPPWLVDRVFRHLLADVTGNTHRTELCIDKLWNPDSASGRQGLIELRAFEMPPDARMSCATQLLIRALTAWFWRTPYEERPVRWGTMLLDRYMLPHFVMQDFAGVLHDLERAGLPFDHAWFAPHEEFRFPWIGRVDVAGATIELRQAIEPWHVLGEQPGAAGTVRYVDSSVERVQVLVRNRIEPRQVITCNGLHLPLQATGTSGEYVAGVRYRAWKPPVALHPTIDVHAPLVFDLVDTWAERSLGGCTYHVGHPGGLAHELRPRNALEAESRRAARFFPFGHTQGTVRPPALARNPDFPLTLDLRLARHV